MQRIGRYELAGEIGRGASGIVYRATDPAIGRTVAVKTLRLDNLADLGERLGVRERLFREARSAGALLHPNIVTIFDAGEEQGVAYIAMELVEGSPLSNRWNGTEAVPNETLMAILRQTAAALDFAHAKGIIHRDVKPANILIDQTLQAKILDFGIAKLASQQMTHTSTLVGTPNYMSPEQIEGAMMDGRSDQFSLAVIAYELLTGERPFRGPTLPALLYQITQQNPQPANLVNPTLPLAAANSLQRALSKHPIGRYRTCTAFVEDLSAALGAAPAWHSLPQGAAGDLPTIATHHASVPPPAAAPASAPVVHELPPARPPRRDDEPARRSWSWVAILGIPALAAGGYFYWASQGGPGSDAATGSVSASSVDRPSPMPDSEAASPVEAAPPPEEASVAPAPGPVDEQQAPAPAGDTPLPNFDSAEPSMVRIATRPPGVRISVDNGNRTCTSPCSLLLDRGQHLVAFSLDTYRPLTRRIEVPRDTSLDVNIDRATGTVTLRSTPGGASIFIDGQPMAQKTPAILTLPVGQHRLRLTVEGKPAYEGEFEIKDQVLSALNVDW
jgi:serine/threonine-protein kinase